MWRRPNYVLREKENVLLFGPVRSAGIYHWIDTTLLKDSGTSSKVTYY